MLSIRQQTDKGHDMLKLMRTFAKFMDVPLRGSKGNGW